MIFNRRAEKMIKQQIDEMTLERIAYVKNDIENAIKYMYWQGAFSKRKAEKMNTLLANKYTEIMNNAIESVNRAMDRDYQAMLKGNDKSNNSE